MKAGEVVNVRLFDHMVVGVGEFYSFAGNKWKLGGKVIKRKL